VRPWNKCDSRNWQKRFRIQKWPQYTRPQNVNLRPFRSKFSNRWR